jgi:UrcA family protein
MKIISILTGFALLGSLSVVAIPAHAQEFEQVSTKVYLGDLDLTTNTGAQAAMSRIDRAARKVCGPDQDWRQFDSRRLYDQCVSQAEDRAVASLDMPMVKAASAHTEQPIRLAAKSR